MHCAAVQRITSQINWSDHTALLYTAYHVEAVRHTSIKLNSSLEQVLEGSEDSQEVKWAAQAHQDPERTITTDEVKSLG